MTKEDLIELITKIRNGEFKTEKERNNLIEKFLQNVPDPEATWLIYRPRLTPEEVVEKALAYKPIIFLPSDGTIKKEEKNNFGVFSRRKNMTKEELIDLVQAICDGYYGPEEDDNEDYFYVLEWFFDNVPYREAADLIFHHQPRFTPEEIVEKALTYDPGHSSPVNNTK